MLVKQVSLITKAATAGARITEAAATAAPRSLFLKASWENDDWKKGATFSRPHSPFPHVHIITRNRISLIKYNHY